MRGSFWGTANEEVAFGRVRGPAGVAVSTGAPAATILYNFSSPSGPLGSTQTYTQSGLTITASGFNSSNVATNLYGKNAGGDENGLGLNNDSTGDHEIEYGHGYIQLDVGSLFGKVTSLGFTTSSTTDGERWAVYGSNTSGVCGTGYAASGCGTALLTGTTELQSTANLLPSFGTYKYYDFVEISNHNGAGGLDANDNFLISSLSGTLAVPEPATWAMLVLGFGLMGGGLRMARHRNEPARTTA
jgi:hypothetical protein